MKIKIYKPTAKEIEKEWDKRNFELGKQETKKKVLEMIDKFFPEIFRIDLYNGRCPYCKCDFTELKQQVEKL
jgi:hypothetical protein